MSGIDESLPLCPVCAKENKILEGPSHWKGRSTYENIWIISNRFQDDNPEYKNKFVIFGRNFDKLDACYFDNINNFTCGWSSKDRIRFKKHDMRWDSHTFERETDIFDSIMKFMKRSFRLYGGCYV